MRRVLLLVKQQGRMRGKMVKSRLILAAFLCALLAGGAFGSVVYIGGTGAISTSPNPNGPLGLLDGGETATAELAYALDLGGATKMLTLTVTNTSPAVLGTQALLVPDAPVISDIFFSVPTSAITGMSLFTANGLPAVQSGWDFFFVTNGVPDTGFGFLKKVFDAGLEGGPGPGSPDPVIASEFDPNIFDGPGDPLASPVDFIFSLTLADPLPAGFNADWFADSDQLGSPEYIAAAKFMSGANGGSGTVTDIDSYQLVPEPAGLVSLLSGLGLLSVYAVRRRSRKAS